MPVCKICGVERTDLTRHLKEEHQITASDYKKSYQAAVVDSSVKEKRKETCLKKYGDPNYKNDEAKKLSNEIFEGGHSLSDPGVRQKARITKQELYGNPNFTNREKAQQTIKEKYGVSNISDIPGVKEKKISTLMKRYGKIFNWERKDIISKEELIRLHHTEGLSLTEIEQKLNMTSGSVTYWMKKHGVEIHKRIVSPKTKEYTPPEEGVREYFEVCLKNGRVLTFGEFGFLTEDRKKQKLKRLFNKGGSCQSLREELKNYALFPEKWTSFFGKMKEIALKDTQEKV